MLIRVGKANDVRAGKMRVFDVTGTDVNVANIDGQLHAFDDKCTHMGCSLARATLEGADVVCPCHGSKFDVTSGEVLRGSATWPVRSRLVQIEGASLLVESNPRMRRDSKD